MAEDRKPTAVLEEAAPIANQPLVQPTLAEQAVAEAVEPASEAVLALQSHWC